MAVRQFGVEAVIQGVGKFLSDLGRMASGFDTVTKSAERAAKTAEQIGQSVDKSNARAISSANSLASANRQLENSFIRNSTAINKAAGDYERYQKIIDKLSSAISGGQLSAQDQAKAQEGLGLAVSRQEAAVNKAIIAWNNYAEAVQKQQTAASANQAAQAGAAGTQQQFASTSQAATQLGSQAAILGGITQALGLSFSAAGIAVQGFGAILGLVGSAIKGVISVFNSLLDAVVNVAKGIANFFAKALEISAGILLAAVINNIVKGLRDLSLSVIDATSNFQLLEIRFTALAARDIAQKQMIPLAQAFTMAGKQAEGLLAWVTQLAIQTPFTTQEIARTLAMANAMGLSLGPAQALTKATIDFASAMGLTEDHIYRIIYNFGQMQAQGKLTGREFRDLAVSFVPINDILTEMGKRFGKTGAEMKKLAFAGGVPVTAFFQDFIDFVSKNFPGAAEKAARTFTGVVSNMKEFAQSVLGLQILKPVFDRITASMANFLQGLLTPEFRNSAHLIGQVLLQAFNVVELAMRDRLIPALKDLASAFGLTNISASDVAVTIAKFGIGINRAVTAVAQIVTQIAGWVREHIGKLQDNGYSWGYNLVSKFAQGMAAAIGAIVRIITAIANLIAHWFKPGSPPQIAPLIPEWGKETAQMWLDGMLQADPRHLTDLGVKVADQFVSGAKSVADKINGVSKTVTAGIDKMAKDASASLSKFSANAMTALTGGFTSADFALFNTISDKIESFLRSIPGMKDNVGLIPRILGTRRAIAQAISDVNSGLITVEDAVNRVTKAAGVGQGVFTTYITALFQVALAQSALNKAQDNYDAISQLTTENLYKIDRILAKITGDLRAQAEQYVVGLRQLAGVEKDLDFQQKLLNATTKKYDAILNDLNNQLRAVTDTFSEQARLEEINKAIASGLLTQQELAKLTAEKRSLEIKAQIRQVEQQRNVEVGAIQDRVDANQAARDALVAQLDSQKTAMLEFADLQRLAAQDALDAAQEQLKAAESTIDMMIKQNDLLQEQADLLKRLKEAGQGGGGGGLDTSAFDALTQAIQSLPTPEDVQKRIQSIFTLARLQLRFELGRLRTQFENAFKDVDFKGMSDSLTTAWGNIKKWWETDMKPIITGFGTDAKISLGSMADSIERIGKALSFFFPGGGAGGVGGLVSLLTFIASDTIATGLWLTATALKGVADFLTSVTDSIKGFQPIWDTFMKQFQNSKGFADDINLFFGLATAWINYWLAVPDGKLYKAFVDVWVGLFQGVKDHWTQFGKDMYGQSIIPDVMLGILNAILAGLDTILVEVPKRLVEITTGLAAGIAIAIGVIAGLIVKAALTPVQDVVNNDLGPALTNLKDLAMAPLNDYMWANLIPTFVTFHDNLLTLSIDTNTLVIGALSNMKVSLTTLNDYISGVLLVTLNRFNAWFGTITTSMDTFIGKTGALIKAMGSIQIAAQSAALAVERLNKALADQKTPKKTTPGTVNISTTTTRGSRTQLLQQGGSAFAGKPYIVGEVGPELFIPKMSGYVLPNDLLNRMVKAFTGLSGNMVVSQATQVVYNIDNSTTVNVNANYAKSQSPSSIYWDVSAALVSSRA